jgi:hypothetical protein
MFLIREIFHCRPGKAGEMVKRFKQMEPIMAEFGAKGTQRVMTDMSGERYWTVVSETEVEAIEQYLNTTRQTMTDPRIQTIMTGYHEIVECGRREIFKIE